MPASHSSRTRAARSPGPGVSRRRFLSASAGIATTTALVPDAALAQDSPKPKASTLAIDGGPRTLPVAPKARRRWGAPEQDRLAGALHQDSLFYWKGAQTTAFTERFRDLCPATHVMPCSSGTAALHIAVAAAGIAPGDEVITTPITDIGTVIGVLYQQGVPVFADLDPHTYNLNPAEVERCMTERTRAIIAVHLCGNPCDLTALRRIADRRQLVLIEDCAQAWGARHQGKPVGSTGHIACWSLQNSKHITCGDGGVVASSDSRFGPLLQRFGDKGMDRLQPGLFSAFATNYRWTELQAAFTVAQLERLEAIVDLRSRLGNRLSRQLEGIPGIHPHQVDPGDRCGYWFYFLRMDPARFRVDRAQFVKALAAEGVEASAGYIPVPLYGNPVFQKHGFFAGRWPLREFGLTRMDYSAVRCPEAESILKTGIRINIHEGLAMDFMDATAAAVRKVAAAYQV